MFLDQGAEFGTLAAGGAADAGKCGDGFGRDGFAVGGEFGAGTFDAATSSAGRDVLGGLLFSQVWAVPSAPSSMSRRAISAW